MSNDNSSSNFPLNKPFSKKMAEATKLLKFLTEIDDIEIIKISLKSIIEILEEENNLQKQE